MKKILLLLSLVLLGTGVFSQEFTINFTGRLNDSQYQRLDSVRITDVTRNWTETLVYPDTVIVVNSTVNISNNEMQAAGFGQNVPNPFDCYTSVELSIPQDENVKLQLYDAAGKQCAELNVALNTGSHRFDITASKPQAYILKAVAGAKTYSVRMINVGSCGGDCIKYVGYVGENAKLTVEHEFQVGDNMEFVGYATIAGNVVESDTILQDYFESQDVRLMFYAPPRVVAYIVNDISSSLITLKGGYFYYPGSAAVTSYGFVYGTSESELLDTVEGVFHCGLFYKELTDLYEDTTYYYRAYAINRAGIGYSDVLSFRTLGHFVDDRDSIIYSMIKIGEQTWMAENLRYEGNIRLGVGNSTSSTIAYRYYPNGISGNLSTYGYLYNWPAVMNGMSGSTANPIGVKGICPNGWHLPSDAEWRQLVDFLGDPEAAGAMLAGKPNLWEGGGLVSSSYFGITGFNALPAGYCHDPNYSSWFGINAGFWSATESDIWRAYSINIYNDNAGVSIGVDYKEYGYNVRCLRDE